MIKNYIIACLATMLVIIIADNKDKSQKIVEMTQKYNSLELQYEHFLNAAENICRICK